MILRQRNAMWPFTIFILILWSTIIHIFCAKSAANSDRREFLLEQYLERIPESSLDANRSILVDGERIFVPKKLPKISKIQKFEMIRRQIANQTNGSQSGFVLGAENKMTIMAELSQRTAELVGGQKVRRALRLQERPWRRMAAPHATHSHKRSQRKPLIAAEPQKCPQRFDAITRAENARTYIFSGELVYEIYRRDGLQQKSAFRIPDLFPDAPRRVNAAFTNRRSGVTMLVGYRTIHRYVWSRRFKQFDPARKHSRHDLPAAVDFIPTLAFQWKDGSLILANMEKFVSYDAFWNVAIHKGRTKDYFPNLPADTVGLAYAGYDSDGKAKIDSKMFIIMTASHGLQFYDLRKSKVIQEYPIAINEYVACLANLHNKL